MCESEYMEGNWECKLVNVTPRKSHIFDGAMSQFLEPLMEEAQHFIMN